MQGELKVASLEIQRLREQIMLIGMERGESLTTDGEATEDDNT